MKKFLAVLLATTVVAGFSACGDSKKSTPSETEKPSEETTAVETTAGETTEIIKELVNKDGKKFTADLTTEGVTAKMDLGSKSVKLCGKTYTMPLKLKDLTADGWELTSINFKNEFKPQVVTNLASFSMKNADGVFLELNEAYNDTKTTQKLEDCLITSISFSNLSNDSSKSSFIFPGGITEDSTAGDIVKVYGNPNDSKIFEGYSYNLETQLTYTKHKDSGLTLTYTFDDDGQLSYAKVKAEVK